eukprot:jgi/Mesen1/5090/ME000252S04203
MSKGGGTSRARGALPHKAQHRVQLPLSDFYGDKEREKTLRGDPSRGHAQGHLVSSHRYRTSASHGGLPGVRGDPLLNDERKSWGDPGMVMLQSGTVGCIRKRRNSSIKEWPDDCEQGEQTLLETDPGAVTPPCKKPESPCNDSHPHRHGGSSTFSSPSRGRGGGGRGRAREEEGEGGGRGGGWVGSGGGGGVGVGSFRAAGGSLLPPEEGNPANGQLTADHSREGARWQAPAGSDDDVVMEVIPDSESDDDEDEQPVGTLALHDLLVYTMELPAPSRIPC